MAEEKNGKAGHGGGEGEAGGGGGDQGGCGGGGGGRWPMSLQRLRTLQ